MILNLDFASMGAEKYFWFAVLLFISFSIGGVGSFIIRNFIEKRAGKKAAKISSRTFQYTVIFIGLEIGLYTILGVKLSSLFTTLGIAGIVVGLAAQQTLQNFIAGIIISLEKPVEIEDWVEVGGVPTTGIARVKDIGFMKTTLRDLDGQLIYIPNSVIVSGKVVNYTHAGFVKEKAELAFSTTEDFMKIKKVAIDIMEKNDRILPKVSNIEKKETLRILRLHKIRKYFTRKIDTANFMPRVVITDLKGGNMTVEIEYWIRDVKNRKYIRSELLRELKDEFKRQKISLA
jgi:small conductance mechanosensitive channel